MFNSSRNINSNSSIDIEWLTSQASNLDNPDVGKALYANLKTLKTGAITVSQGIQDEATSLDGGEPLAGQSLTFQITWDERAQSFSAKESDVREGMKVSSFSAAEKPVSLAAVAVAQALNGMAQRVREGRRADHYSINAQDPNNFHRELLSLSNNSEKDTIIVAHQNSEETLMPSPLATGASEKLTLSSQKEVVHASDLKAAAIGGTSLSLLQDRPVLLYGFDGPRAKLIDDLRGNFGLTKIQTVNDYNANIGIEGPSGAFDFTKYCQFLKEANSNALSTRITSPVSSKCTEAEMHAWAGCLTENVSKFDFAKKLNSPEKRVQFFLKNCDLNKVLSLSSRKKIALPANLKAAFNNKNWSEAVAILQPAFDVLESATRLPIDTDTLKSQYDGLTSGQKLVLDITLSRAFLRKTSKLGLSFAREQGQVVLFAWGASGVENNLEGLHDLLEVKPYKDEHPEFRLNSQKSPNKQLSPEGITFSEMRELGRLKQKMMAPNYVLITKITSSATVLKSFADYDTIADQYVEELDGLNKDFDIATEAVKNTSGGEDLQKAQALDQFEKARDRLRIGIAKARAATDFASLPFAAREAALKGGSFEAFIAKAIAEATGMG